MRFDLAGMFRELGQILGVCPCCGELFYLSEARPYLDGKRPHSMIDGLRVAERRLENAEQALNDAEQELRQKAALSGLRTAKKLLKNIDPVFSDAGYDPQDVKVIFNPVTYVVFEGMSKNKLKTISLLAKEPEDKLTERVQSSIGKAIKSGNVEFKTLHVDREGKVLSQ
jgi:predicted Holliday junction resolvase-like endonuclease